MEIDASFRKGVPLALIKAEVPTLIAVAIRFPTETRLAQYWFYAQGYRSTKHSWSRNKSDWDCGPGNRGTRPRVLKIYRYIIGLSSEKGRIRGVVVGYGSRVIFVEVPVFGTRTIILGFSFLLTIQQDVSELRLTSFSSAYQKELEKSLVPVHISL